MSTQRSRSGTVQASWHSHEQQICAVESQACKFVLERGRVEHHRTLANCALKMHGCLLQGLMHGFHYRVGGM